MPNRTFALHTSEQIIADVDAKAKELRRSRNSIINEAIEKFLYPPNGHAPTAELLVAVDRRAGFMRREAAARKKKAGISK